MRIYRETVLQKKTTKSTVVYGNQEIPTLYFPKAMLRAVCGKKGPYPQELILSLRTTGNSTSTVNSLDLDQKRLVPTSETPGQQSIAKDPKSADLSKG